MVVALGSMAIKGVFKAGSLLSGLGKTAGKLKEVKQRGKSTTTEMKRMTSGANMLKGALAAIGVAGFSALLLTTPQLAGSLAKIKHEMTMIAWSIGKHLKPALDAVATILRGIRTGDWDTVKKGVQELATAVWDLVAAAASLVIDAVFGEGAAAKAKTDFDNWIDTLKKAWDEGDAKKFVVTLVLEPIKWVLARVDEWLKSIAKQVETSEGKKKLTDSLIAKLSFISPGIGGAKASYDLWKSFGANKLGDGQHRGDPLSRLNEWQTNLTKKALGTGQTGLNVPRTGMYRLHAGETVTMRGSTPEGGSGSTDITIDFSGANIHLASGIELDQFAEALSNRIAERQHSLTY